MSDREETLRRLEAFNKRAEELLKAAPAPATPLVVPDATGQELLEAPVTSLNTAQRLERQAVQTSSDLARQEREREATERLRQQEEGKAIDKMQASGAAVVSGALDAAQPPIRWLENIPTPAGLGTLFALIVIFLLAIVPVDNAGNTRLKLIWFTLTGKTHLAPLPAEASGDFGPGSNKQDTSTTPTTSSSPSITQPPVNNLTIPDLSGLNLFEL